ncbi:DUF6033 family protein [Vallitalea maricola]|uniref:Uncharacterized protein n=1 Tax=Vallitalea maricola TaxID=3074433 RepID=A0ACB5URU7_9FIRM|nr:hypothetical protein AN2V17_41430 [Vallitalea sp. AN17-2]
MQGVQLLSNYLTNPNLATQRATANKIGFSDKLAEVKSNDILNELENYYGVKIDVKSIGKDDKSVSSYATSLGASPIAIAPNILEKMKTDEELKERITGCISRHIESIPSGRKYLMAHGRQLIATGTIVHEDGTVTHWTVSDESPEQKEKIRKQMETEEEEKLARKKAINEASEDYMNKIRSNNYYTSIIKVDNIVGHNSDMNEYLHDCVMVSNYKNRV